MSDDKTPFGEFLASADTVQKRLLQQLSGLERTTLYRLGRKYNGRNGYGRRASAGVADRLHRAVEAVVMEDSMRDDDSRRGLVTLTRDEIGG